MKKSKKLLSILLCLVTILSLTVGCASNKDDKVIRVGATQVPGEIGRASCRERV